METQRRQSKRTCRIEARKKQAKQNSKMKSTAMEIVPETIPIKPIQMEEEEKINDPENDFGQVIFFKFLFDLQCLDGS